MLSPAEIRARYDRVRGEVGEGVTIVAATKYVTAADMGLLVEAGITTVGENRAQDLEAKYAMYGDAFEWHFIGALQSNKAKVVNARCELVHSVDTDSTAGRLTIPMLIQVNIANEDTKSGIRPSDLENYLQYDVRGLSTMPPATATADQSRTWFRALRELAQSHDLRDLSMGTTQDYAAAAQEGATYIRVGSTLFR